MPTAIGWRISRRLYQMLSTANIGIVFGSAIKKAEVFAPAFIKRLLLLPPNTHSGYNDFVDRYLVSTQIFTDSANFQVYNTICP